MAGPLRSAARSLFARILAYSLLPLLIRQTIQRNRVTILVYHRPTEATMIEHLRFLKSRYTIISLRHFVEAWWQRDLGSLPRRSLVITFDDGDRSNWCLTQLFSGLRIPATIFVCTGIVGTTRPFWFRHAPNVAALTRVPDEERLMRLEDAGFEKNDVEREALSRSEILEMSNGAFDFQSHTVTHAILPYCAPAKAMFEISESKRQLEDELGFDVFALAYPNGDYSDRDMVLARAAGYTCALTVDLGFNTCKTDVFRLRRIAIDDRDGRHQVAVKACGLWGRLKQGARDQPYGYVRSPSGVKT